MTRVQETERSGILPRVPRVSATVTACATCLVRVCASSRVNTTPRANIVRGAVTDILVTPSMGAIAASVIVMDRAHYVTTGVAIVFAPPRGSLGTIVKSVTPKTIILATP